MSEAPARRQEALASLALGPGADDAEIRSAYRRLVMRYHPDASGDSRSSKRFVRVVRAYKVLVANPAPRSARRSFRSVDEAGGDIFALGQVLASDPEPEARSQAVRALGLSGRACAYIFLRRAFYDRDREVALEAVRAAALLGSRQAEGEVAALYARAEARVRRGILELALATGERLFASTLVAAASDEDPSLRLLAARSR